MAAAGVAAALAGAALLFAHDPAGSALLPPCPFHAATGLHCPGCGTLRAVHRLLHGDVRGALSMNALMVVSIPVLLALWIWPRWTRHPRVAWTTFGVLIGYAVVRNVPLWPCSLLAPG